MSIDKSQENLFFELAGYLVTCATMALSGEREGSPRYSANRFLIALRKLIGVSEHTEKIPVDTFLIGIVQKLDNIRLEHKELEELQLEFAVEALKRINTE